MKGKEQDSVAGEAMESNLIVEQKGHTFPRTPAEELIAGIYASNLNVAPLGVYDNLPSLGFTPQVAAPVKLRLQQIFQVDVPIDRLLLHTTIDSIISLLSELWGGREIVEEIAWTFLQIEQLSDDEVGSQLTNEFSTAQAVSEEPDKERIG